VGDGTIAFATGQEMMSGKPVELPRNPPPLGGRHFVLPPEGVVAAINIQRVLDRLLREMARLKPKRKRGNQKELGKVVIVAHAASFFRRYSTKKPTKYPYGPFVKFCRKFYEIVTGEPLSPGGLQKAIGIEVKKPTFGTQNPQKT
jgi:hypothetical protein